MRTMLELDWVDGRRGDVVHAATSPLESDRLKVDRAFAPGVVAARVRSARVVGGASLSAFSLEPEGEAVVARELDWPELRRGDAVELELEFERDGRFKVVLDGEGAS